MQTTFRNFTLGLVLTAVAAFGQAKKPAFEVATIRPSAPLDVQKMAAVMQSGGKLPIGATITAKRAEYLYLDLRSLMMYAYGVKPYQITGPDWLATNKFDIVATLPEGSTKEDAAKMLQTLLEDRFKLTVHRTSAEHPVTGLVVGKGGPKLKTSAGTPVAIDESAPLGPGEQKMDSPDGPMRMKMDMTNGRAVIDMGVKGQMSYKMNPATQSLHMDFSMVTMDGFADMVTQIMTSMAQGQPVRQIVNMTDIKGNYDASLEIGLQEIIAMIKSSGMDIPGLPSGGGGANGGTVSAASDPGAGGTSLTDAASSMGLKLEARKAMVDQLIIDHVEKMPTDN